MEIKFANTNYTLTTDHPASSYQLGVLVDSGDGVYMPSNPLPTDPAVLNYFGDDLPSYLAGEFVRDQLKNHFYTLTQLALIRRYLMQDPQGRFKLPDDIDIYIAASENVLNDIMGDTSQGVHPVYYTEGKAKVAVMIYESSDGKYAAKITPSGFLEIYKED